MKVILIEDVDGLGRIGDIVDVASGYGRNYLIPKGFAILANRRNIKALEHEKGIHEKRAQKSRDRAEELSGKIDGTEVFISARVGEEGKLFGAVTSADIASALTEKGVEVDKKQVLLDSVIKTEGEHAVSIKTSPGVTAQVVVRVVPAK